MKKLNQQKRSTDDLLLATLKRNAEKATEPELVPRLRAAIRAIMEARRG
jgi:hypothetical protein